MEQDKKNTLTEKLKVLETEVKDKKAESKMIQVKLNISYEYETELLERLEKCKQNRMALTLESNKKNKEILELFDKMKKVLDVFTGNFYNHD